MLYRHKIKVKVSAEWRAKGWISNEVTCVLTDWERGGTPPTDPLLFLKFNHHNQIKEIQYYKATQSQPPYDPGVRPRHDEDVLIWDTPIND